MKRECHRCGKVTTVPCRDCTNAAQRPYNDRTYQALRAELIAAEPWCHSIPCPYDDAGTPTNPLTADHVTPLRAIGPSYGLSILCRRCNSAKGGRLDLVGGGSNLRDA